jgi:hypothetical protein
MPSSVDHLTGFAHGAAGYGHAFVELFRVTGDPWFRHAAEQAFAYERDRFDEAAGNWPDYRHRDVSEFTSGGHFDLLRERLRAGTVFPPYTPTFHVLWCHGAPGIGLSRLRAYEVLGDDLYRREAEVAAETTLSFARAEEQNYSLCHGHFGNCETLLVAGRLLGRGDLLRAAEERAARGQKDYEARGRPWPCGTIAGVADPSLLLGEAGIGYFFLRLLDDATPAILCLGASGRVSVDRPQRDSRVLVRDHVRVFFGETLDRLERLGKTIPLDSSSADDVVTSVHKHIQARISAEESLERRRLVEQAAAVDLVRFELDSGDGVQELVDALSRPGTDEVDWHVSRFRIADGVRLIIESDIANLSNGDEANGEDTITAVFRLAGEVRTHRLSPFGAAVLTSAVEAGSVKEISERVAALADSTAGRLAPMVLEQLKQAWLAGIIDYGVASEPAAEMAMA